MGSRTQFNEFIDKSLRTDGVEGIHQLCSAIGEAYGFDHFIYGTSFPTSLVKPFVLVISGQPNAWRSHYEENGYLAVDPAVRHCMRSIRPLIWQDLQLDPQTDEKSFRVMHEAREFGLASGASLSIRGGRGEVGVLSFSSERTPHQTRPEIESAIPDLYLLSAYVHEAAGRLVTQGALPFNPPELTARERECLLWAAEGKTSWEIARILGISERTAIFHLQNAARRLNASSRQQAVALAISQGLISLQLG